MSKNIRNRRGKKNGTWRIRRDRFISIILGRKKFFSRRNERKDDSDRPSCDLAIEVSRAKFPSDDVEYCEEKKSRIGKIFPNDATIEIPPLVRRTRHTHAHTRIHTHTYAHARTHTEAGHRRSRCNLINARLFYVRLRIRCAKEAETEYRITRYLFYVRRRRNRGRGMAAAIRRRRRSPFSQARLDDIALTIFIMSF